MPTHPYLQLDEYGQSAEVDEGMVDLIRALWRHGITTLACCQGEVTDDWNSAYVSIEAHDFPRFLHLVGDCLEVTDMAQRERLQIHLGAKAAFGIYWAINLREEFDGAIFRRNGEWHVSITTRFPAAFIPELTAALEAA